jgi:hypothetical protein
VAIFSHPFADENAEEEQPQHHARDGSRYDRLIDLHILKAEAELKFWQAEKAGDERAGSRAAAEREKIDKEISAMTGDDRRGDDNDD